jgi:hypothetical protein
VLVVRAFVDDLLRVNANDVTAMSVIATAAMEVIVSNRRRPVDEELLLDDNWDDNALAAMASRIPFTTSPLEANRLCVYTTY